MGFPNPVEVLVHPFRRATNPEGMPTRIPENRLNAVEKLHLSRWVAK
jgi:hypothetical protein